MSSDKSKVELEASGPLIEKRQSVRPKELVPDIANIDKVSNVELPAAISNDIEKNCANPTNPIEVTRSESTGSTNATDASCSLATSSTTRDKENIDKIQRQTNNDSGVDSAGTDATPNTSKNLPSQPTYSNAPNKLRNPNSNPVMNGSSPASLTSPDGTRSSSNSENLSKTNLYIRGLASSTTDEDLYNMCAKYGTIFSTKAIFDKTTGCCKGYGFVQYTTPQSAESAVIELNKNGVLAQMARIPTFHSSQDQHYGHNHHSNNNHHNNSQPGHGNHQSQFHRNNHNYNIGSAGLSNQHQSQDVMNNQHNHADPTNLYIANLPPNMSEEELSTLLSSYGPVISTRILRDERNMTRRVGFARMETSDKCQEVIEELNGLLCKGCTEPLLVKFADGGNRKRHHHNNHRHFNNRHMHHHRFSQEDHRWREEVHTNNSSNMSSFEQHGNISHCNQATDLAMMGTVGYPRMPQPFPPSMNPGQGYHGQTTSPQWVHPGGQPWGVISPQMMQPGSLGTPNQAPVASAAYPYAHLASQMQGLQISHHGAHMAGYLQPHHQWPAVWPQPMPRHHHPPSVRMSRHQDDVSTLQAQQTLKQHSSESAVNEPDMQRGYQHKLSINVGDSAEKPQVSTPM